MLTDEEKKMVREEGLVLVLCGGIGSLPIKSKEEALADLEKDWEKYYYHKTLDEHGNETEESKNFNERYQQGYYQKKEEEEYNRMLAEEVKNTK